jgi:hypothetical protein
MFSELDTLRELRSPSSKRDSVSPCGSIVERAEVAQTALSSTERTLTAINTSASKRVSAAAAAVTARGGGESDEGSVASRAAPAPVAVVETPRTRISSRATADPQADDEEDDRSSIDLDDVVAPLPTVDDVVAPPRTVAASTAEPSAVLSSFAEADERRFRDQEKVAVRLKQEAEVRARSAADAQAKAASEAQAQAAAKVSAVAQSFAHKIEEEAVAAAARAAAAATATAEQTNSATYSSYEDEAIQFEVNLIKALSKANSGGHSSASGQRTVVLKRESGNNFKLLKK